MKLITSLMPVLVLAGCAHMAVDVRILDKEYWLSPQQINARSIERLEDIIREERNGGFDKARQQLKDNTGEALDVLVRNGQLNSEDRPKIYAPVSEYIDAGYACAKKEFQTAFNVYATSQTRGWMEMFTILEHINNGFQNIENVKLQIEKDLRKNSLGATSALTSGSDSQKAKAVESLAAVDKAIKKNDAATRGLIGDQGIQNDELASAVVHAPEEFWRRQDSPEGINRTEAFGGFGNTDIAIKMQSIGSFTIKGVRLDSSKITQATFAVGRQAIKTIAAIYGVPLPTGSGPAPTPATATTENPYPERSIGFASPEGRVAEAEREALRIRLARIGLMESIILQKAALESLATGDEAKNARATAVKAIKDAFVARRADLDPPPAAK